MSASRSASRNFLAQCRWRWERHEPLPENGDLPGGNRVTAQAKILVVDDTPHNVKLLADVLGVKGYAVATAATGEEALAKIPMEKPDLILLDIMMPGLSGYDVCRRIRADAATALLPVVLVTSLYRPQERVHGIEAG